MFPYASWFTSGRACPPWWVGGNSQFDQEDSQGDSGVFQDTLRLSPNVHQFSPKALPSPDQPEESPTTEEGKEEEIPQEEDEEESDGRLTPPCGFVLSSNGMVHGDTSIAQDNPMLAMIMSAMSGVLAHKLVECEEDAEMGQGKGKGKVGSKGGEGKGYDAGTGASSSFMTPVSKPKRASPSLWQRRVSLGRSIRRLLTEWAQFLTVFDLGKGFVMKSLKWAPEKKYCWIIAYICTIAVSKKFRLDFESQFDRSLVEVWSNFLFLKNHMLRTYGIYSVWEYLISNSDQTSSKLLQNFESKFHRNFDETARVNPNLMIGVMLFSQKGFLQTVGCLMISSVNLIETSLQPLGIISVVKHLEKTLRVPWVNFEPWESFNMTCENTWERERYRETPILFNFLFFTVRVYWFLYIVLAYKVGICVALVPSLIAYTVCLRHTPRLFSVCCSVEFVAVCRLLRNSNVPQQQTQSRRRGQQAKWYQRLCWYGPEEEDRRWQESRCRRRRRNLKAW